MPGEMPENAERNTRLYSDVVRSRSASPRGETVVHDPVSAPDDLIKPVEDYRDDGYASSRASRARSLDSPRSVREVVSSQIETIDNEIYAKERVIEAATEFLTKEEKERIQR